MGRHSAAAPDRRWQRRFPSLPLRSTLAAAVGVATLLTAGLTAARRTSSHQTARGSVLPPAPASHTTPAPHTTPATTPGSAAAAPADITMAFAGDVHFAGRVASRAAAGAGLFGPIGQTLAAADISMVNLESAITEGGAPEPKQFHFRASASALDSLRAASVDVVTMANNHAVDYGPVGLSDSLAAIRSHGEPVVGIGSDAAAAYAPWYAEVRGTRVAVLAASQIHDRTLSAWAAGPDSPGIAAASSGQLVAAVRGARAQAQVVVVYLHWGTEGHECPNAEQRAVARQLADAGADAVVGTHAHLLLGAGWLGSTYVDYGLGNFLWWRDHAYSNDTGVLTLTFHGRRVTRGQLTPAVIDADGVPRPAHGADARRVADTLARASRCAGLADSPG